ncbi:hypothetical protein ACFKHW_32015 [Bradyrhizobium lupini]|uniref:hypothetical protein n=1 Tax=Rhizobium lupini TaxID=136996 RepID=UPI00366D4F86
MRKLEDDFILAHKRQLLEVRERLDQLRWVEGKQAEYHAILADPAKADQHVEVTRKLAVAKSTIEACNEMIALITTILGLEEDKLELQKQLAEIDDTFLEE